MQYVIQTKMLSSSTTCKGRKEIEDLIQIEEMFWCSPDSLLIDSGPFANFAISPPDPVRAIRACFPQGSQFLISSTELHAREVS